MCTAGNGEKKKRSERLDLRTVMIVSYQGIRWYDEEQSGPSFYTLSPPIIPESYTVLDIYCPGFSVRGFHFLLSSNPSCMEDRISL